MEGDLAVKRTAANDLKGKRVDSEAYGSKDNLASMRTGDGRQSRRI